MKGNHGIQRCRLFPRSRIVFAAGVPSREATAGTKGGRGGPDQGRRHWCIQPISSVPRLPVGDSALYNWAMAGEKARKTKKIHEAASALATLFPPGPDREQCEAELTEAVRELEEKFPSPNGPPIVALVNALYLVRKKI